MTPKNPIPRSNTRSVKGDAQLTTVIDPFSFLEDFWEEELLDEESPEEGQCQ